MSFSDSMFLFEIVVEELKSYVNCRTFQIKCDFADIFSLDLKDPNELASVLRKPRKKKKYDCTSKVRNPKSSSTVEVRPNVQTGQSVLLANNIYKLISIMKTFPIELSLWSKTIPKNKLGSTHIRWSKQFIEYLCILNKRIPPPPVSVTREYKVFDESTLKRIAIIKLKIKLDHLTNKITTQFMALSENNPETFLYTGFNSKPITILSTIKEGKGQDRVMLETGIVKATSGQRKHISKKFLERHQLSKTKVGEDLSNESHKNSTTKVEIVNNSVNNRVCLENGIDNNLRCIRSETSIDADHQLAMVKSKSCSSVQFPKLNPLSYIFGDWRKSYGNQVYCVGYFTVEQDNSSKKSPSEINSGPERSDQSGESKEKYKLSINDCNCPKHKGSTGSCSPSLFSLDLPKELAKKTKAIKCQQLDCDNKKHKEPPLCPDDRILLDLSSMTKDCCSVKVDEVVVGMQTKMKIDKDPCFCTCECRFDVVKQTTYCKICGGYEVAGEEIAGKGNQLPFPCPIFHKLVDKTKKTSGTSGSDSKKRAKSKISEKGAESETGMKGKKKKIDDRFKNNYGYLAPHIGHSRCATPCNGTLGAVPKNMGWLWTAELVPGMRFRPLWKPGAINKHVLRLLRMAKNPGEIISKKRRKEIVKRPRKRPLLTVQKKDGEYTVTMETMKIFSKPRAINQQPYEDKPVITYTIGRTEEENRERKKKRDREQRRLERDQREFIQRAFKNMCHEICLKTYQQALGILPETENPECPCYPAHPGADKTNLDVSCSCSEDKLYSIGSDTDDDEWLVEFTPPIATFDPTFKPKRITKNENSTQYTYLDYRIKLLDRFGNPVPRYFKGPDGKQQCSDLGGFWGPNHTWLEINVDGYVAPDGRWAPTAFIGPGGEQIEDEGGKFQFNGRWLVVGVDGYVDSQGKWRYYLRPKGVTQFKHRASGKNGGDGDKIGGKPLEVAQSGATWSCFGDASPVELSKMGIVGHGQDKILLLTALKELLAKGETVNIPEPSTVPRSPASKKDKKIHPEGGYRSSSYFEERNKCRHPVPSDKGISAVDGHGNKTYFRLTEPKNFRPKDRLKNLNKQGISLSSFHVPCFHSFVNTELMKQQLRERLMVLSGTTKSKGVSTQDKAV